jgi:tetratricopeptide (TPR) repeat protein
MQRDRRHDHAFLRPDPELTLTLGIPNACNRCHTDRDAEWARDHTRSWYPDDRVRVARRRVAEAIAKGRQGDAAAVPVLLETVGTARDAVRRASAVRLLGRFPTASGVSTGLRQALADDEPLVRASAARTLSERTHLEPDLQEALLPLLRDDSRIVRQHAAFALRSASPLKGDLQAALAQATDEWLAGQRWLADTPEAQYNLGVFFAGRGDVAAAQAAYTQALRLWPRAYRARHNLGMLLAQAGDLEGAAQQFEAVLANDPVPDSSFALGLLRAQQGRWREAIAALERCVAEVPSYPRARYNLALARAKTGDYTAALDELERAAALADSRREAVLTLIDLARQVGDKARLERWVLEGARLGADDPALGAAE